MWNPHWTCLPGKTAARIVHRLHPNLLMGTRPKPREPQENLQLVPSMWMTRMRAAREIGPAVTRTADQSNTIKQLDWLIPLFTVYDTSQYRLSALSVTNLWQCQCSAPHNPKLDQRCNVCEEHHQFCDFCERERRPVGQDKSPESWSYMFFTLQCLLKSLIWFLYSEFTKVWWWMTM